RVLLAGYTLRPVLRGDRTTSAQEPGHRLDPLWIDRRLCRHQCPTCLRTSNALDLAHPSRGAWHTSRFDSRSRHAIEPGQARSCTCVRCRLAVDCQTTLGSYRLARESTGGRSCRTDRTCGAVGDPSSGYARAA